MSNISELLDNFAIDNIRLMQGSSDMDSIEKDRAEILQAFAEKDKKIYELESENLSLQQDKAIIDNYVKELEAQVEKMKC